MRPPATTARASTTTTMRPPVTTARVPTTTMRPPATTPRAPTTTRAVISRFTEQQEEFSSCPYASWAT
jgi:hypothetical protein